MQTSHNSNDNNPLRKLVTMKYYALDCGIYYSASVNYAYADLADFSKVVKLCPL